MPSKDQIKEPTRNGVKPGKDNSEQRNLVSLVFLNLCLEEVSDTFCMAQISHHSLVTQGVMRSELCAF